MSDTNEATGPPATRKRRLRSWAGATAADGDGDVSTDSTGAASAAGPPAECAAAAAASVLSAEHSSSTPQQRKKVRRQQLLAAAFGDQPRPPRWRDLSSAQRCFSDGLALSFSFLSLIELIPAARTCRSWREAGLKANVAGAELHSVVTRGSAEERQGGSMRLRSLASSPFRRHVRELTHDDDDNYDLHMRGIFTPPEWTLLDLATLQHLPQLRRISNVRVELTSALPGQALRFPPLLESADLTLSFAVALLDESDDGWNTAPLQRLVLKALRPCHSLTKLIITLRPWTDLCLDGLLELSSLRILMLDIEHADDGVSGLSKFTEDHMRIIKQLPNLRDLFLRECDELDGNDEDDPFGTRWLRWLCPLPHRLQQLEEIDLGLQHLEMEHMELLQQLPALTALEPFAMDASVLPLLPNFAERLQRLRLDALMLGEGEVALPPEMLDFETQLVRAPLFLPHLTPCTALAKLMLSKCVFTAVEAMTLCQALTQLRELDLDDVGWPSFESLRHLPQLEVFSLRRNKTAILPLHFDAAHFRPLQQLRDLTLIGVHPQAEAAVDAVDALRPPSTVLPALVHFCFSP